MATGPARRVAASALNKTAKIAKATASKHLPLRSAPTSPTVAAKPTGVKASNTLSQSPPPAITTTPAAAASSSSSSSSPLSPTTELTKEGSSGGAPSPPGGSGGGAGGGQQQQQQGNGDEEAPQQQSRPFPKWKAAVWTLAFTAVTVTGTIYGAGLKTQKEWNQEKQKVQEATAEDKIEMLVNRRAQLFKTKIEIEQKLADVRERMRLDKEKEEKEKSGAVAMPRR